MPKPVTKIAKHSLRSIHVRPSEAQLARIDKMKLVTGKSAPQLLLESLLDRAGLERPLFMRSDADELLLELRRHGNNLNQIGKKVNSGIRHGWNKSFDSLMTAYRVLEHKLTVNRAHG